MQGQNLCPDEMKNYPFIIPITPSYLEQWKNVCYHISLVIRWSFFSSKNQTTIDLDPSYKTDLDLWDCLGRVKLILYQTFMGLI